MRPSGRKGHLPPFGAIVRKDIFRASLLIPAAFAIFLTIWGGSHERSVWQVFPSFFRAGQSSLKRQGAKIGKPLFTRMSLIPRSLREVKSSAGSIMVTAPPFLRLPLTFSISSHIFPASSVSPTHSSLRRCPIITRSKLPSGILSPFNGSHPLTASGSPASPASSAASLRAGSLLSAATTSLAPWSSDANDIGAGPLPRSRTERGLEGKCPRTYRAWAYETGQ